MTALKCFFYGLLIWALYLLSRSGLQQLLPAPEGVGGSWLAYVQQDLAISVFRLSCGLACLWVLRRRYTSLTVGLKHWQLGGAMAWLAALALITCEVMGGMSQASDWVTANWIRAVEVAIALIVAFNEELGFRGLLQSSARELFGRKGAVWVTALLFTAMHYGYQPNFHLIKVFFIGVTLGLLRDRGASLRALIVLHFLLDLPSAWLLSGNMTDWNIYNLSVFVAALAALMAFEAEDSLPAAPGERLLFVYGSLMPGREAAQRFKLERRADDMGVTNVTGRLYLVEGYPGLISGKGERIQGSLFRLRDEKLLQELDEYEGELYARDLVSCENGREAWAYVLKRAPKKSASLAGRTATCYT